MEYTTRTNSETLATTMTFEFEEQEPERWVWVGKYLKLMIEGLVTPKDLSPKAVVFIKSQEMYYREKFAKMGKTIEKLNQKLKENNL